MYLLMRWVEVFVQFINVLMDYFLVKETVQHQ